MPSSVMFTATNLRSRCQAAFPAERFEFAVAIVWTSVTSTTPGTGSSITSMIVSSTGASTTWFSGFLDALVATTFGARCLFVMDLRATQPARRTFNFTFSPWLALLPTCASPWRLPCVVLTLFCAWQHRFGNFAFSYRGCNQTVSKQPTIAAVDDSPQWRFAISIAHRSQRRRVRLKSPDPEQAIRKIIGRAGQRNDLRVGRRHMIGLLTALQ
jgi:hypothetical protein